MPFKDPRTGVYQYDLQIDGRRFRGSCGTKTLSEAKRIEAQIRLEARQARSLRNRGFTLDQALGTYFRDVSQGQPSEATTASQIRGILAHLDGATPIADLTDAEILGFVARRRAACSAATVNRQLQLLGRALRHMGRAYGAKVPELTLRRAEIREPRERIRELSAAEQTALFEALPAEMHPPVSFALLTGARISTICDLQWRDIDPAARVMRFRLKGGEEMSFPISAEIDRLLEALPRAEDLPARRYVFTRVHGKTGKRIPIVPNGGVFAASWRAAVAEAGIEDFRFHDLRHTFASRMLRQTGNLKLVSKMLGHSSIETTTRYAHVMLEDMSGALDAFSPLHQGAADAPDRVNGVK